MSKFEIAIDSILKLYCVYCTCNVIKPNASKRSYLISRVIKCNTQRQFHIERGLIGFVITGKYRKSMKAIDTGHLQPKYKENFMYITIHGKISDDKEIRKRELEDFFLGYLSVILIYNQNQNRIPQHRHTYYYCKIDIKAFTTSFLIHEKNIKVCQFLDNLANWLYYCLTSPLYLLNSYSDISEVDSQQFILAAQKIARDERNSNNITQHLTDNDV